MDTTSRTLDPGDAAGSVGTENRGMDDKRTTDEGRAGGVLGPECRTRILLTIEGSHSFVVERRSARLAGIGATHGNRETRLMQQSA